MERVCKINCKGHCGAPENWINVVANGINRLYYIEKGSGEYFENGAKHKFLPGMVYFIPYYAGIPTYSDGKDKIVHSYVNFKSSPPIVSKTVLCLDPESSAEIKAAVELFRRLCKTHYNYRECASPITEKEERELELLGAVAMFIADYAIRENPDSIIRDTSIITALDLMHGSMKDKLSIADIAAKCYMSYDGFIRKFTHYVGETPYSYLKRIKVSKALELKASGVSVEEAAVRCGYSDASALLHAIASISKV